MNAHGKLRMDRRLLTSARSRYSEPQRVAVIPDHKDSGLFGSGRGEGLSGEVR